MSTVKTNAAQIGQSLTATNNFTLYQPASPDGTVRLGNGNAGSVTDAVILNSSGNLGLGVTPSAWGANRRAEEISGAAVSSLSLNGTGAYSEILTNAYYNGTNFIYKNTGVASSNDFNIRTSGGYTWSIAPSGTAGNAISFTQAMTLDASGNLGIGTSSPLSAAGYTALTVQNTTYGGIVEAKDSTVTLRMQTGLSGVGAIGTVSNHPLVFWTNTTERMRIDSSGNLLVGTTTSNIYNTNTAGYVFASAGSFGQVTSNYEAFLLTSKNASASIRFYLATAGEKGNISVNSGGTTYNTVSDYRLKENIQPMQNGLEFCRKQRPVIYDWKADGSKGSGYIAHWMQEDGAGNCVTGEKDAVDKDGKPVYQGIDTSFMVAPLNAGLNELADIVEAQAEMLAQLKAELDATKAKVAALKGA